MDTSQDILTDLTGYYDYLDRQSLHLKLPVVFTPDEGISTDLGELDIDIDLDFHK